MFDHDGRRGSRLLSELGFKPGQLRIWQKQLAYPDYLREIARHKIVLQLDTSFVPGQVAGDALLCRVPCVGGNGAIDRLGFPETSGFAREIGEVGAIASRLLNDGKFYQAMVAKLVSSATKILGFQAVSRQLGEFFK